MYGESVVIPLPAILPADRIRAFQEALAEVARPRRIPLGDHPLTGRINDGVRTYRCSGWQEAISCGCVFLRADHIEEQVVRYVNALHGRHATPHPADVVDVLRGADSAVPAP